MIRTRDFILFACIVVFLLLSIGTTLFSRQDASTDVAANRPTLVATDPGSFAVIPADDIEAERQQRIASLREIIAAGTNLTLSEGDAEEDPEQVAFSAEQQLCPQYRQFVDTYTGSLTIEIVEGARVVYEESTRPAGTSTVQNTRQQVAVLPITPIVSPVPHCLPTDVIGITLSGEFITNESVRYSDISESMLVGYALDGYPIFGVTDATRDQCGGVVVSGLYRYQIDPTQDTILNCFNATPVTL